MPELNSIRLDADKTAEIRGRLSDISWWMRLLCQRISQRANREDGAEGKLFLDGAAGEKFLRSALAKLPLPSAMLAEMERAARFSWLTRNP